MKGQLRIDQLFAFTCVDVDGTEGVVGVLTGDGWVPLVGANMIRVNQLRPEAQRIANETRRKVLVKRFSTMTVLEELLPQGAPRESHTGADA